MTRVLVAGIDVGVTGAVALLDDDGCLIDSVDMPCLFDGPKSRRAVNAPLLADILKRAAPAVAYVEIVGPRPGEGSVSAFAFGRTRGAIEGLLAAIGIPVVMITPPTWKKIIGIPAGKAGAKDMARSEAIRRWPNHARLFARVKDDGRAEAALIAVAGMMRAHQKRLAA